MATDRGGALAAGVRTIAGLFKTTPATLADGEYDVPSIDDRRRLYVSQQNREVTVLASAARTTTFNGADQTNDASSGIALYLDVTAASGTTPTLTVKVQWKDPVSGGYIDLLNAAFAAKTVVSTDDLMIYPGITTSANRRVSSNLPRTWRLVCTIGGTTPSFTFSVGGVLLI